MIFVVKTINTTEQGAEHRNIVTLSHNNQINHSKITVQTKGKNHIQCLIHIKPQVKKR